MKLRTLVLGMCLLAALTACDSSALQLVPDTQPNVAIASINGVEARSTPEGYLLAPASRMYDPNDGTTSPNNVPVAVTASDERQVTSVAASLTDAQGDSWEDALTFDSDEEIFRNPFVFSVPFEGTNSGLSTAQLELTATDSASQVNAPYSAAVRVDGSLPIFTASLPTTEQSGVFGLSGSVSDPESGIQEFAAFIDGALLATSEETTVTSASFATTVDANELGNGTHYLTLYAVNGVNEPVLATYAFDVSVNAAPTAEDDEATTDIDTTVTIDVLANDSDEDGDILSITAVTTPAHGTAVIVGSALIEYTPDAGFSGGDSFFYTIKDSKGAVDSGQVTVTVGAVPATP